MKQTLWTEIYRPKKMEELVIPKGIEKLIRGYLQKKDVPNMLFYGKAGTAKTTTAKVIANELGSDVLYINMSDETGKNEILEKVIPFASSVSMQNTDAPKIVIGDECDRLTPQAQDSLKAHIEQFSKNCRFIFVANTPSRIIPPIKSRVTSLCFDIPAAERADLMMKFFTRTKEILEKNQIPFEGKILGRHIASVFPDYRQVILTIQNYVNAHGKLDEGILTATKDDIAPLLYGFIQNKKFTEARKWLRESLYSPGDIIDALYTGLEKNVPLERQPEMILIISEYAYKSSFVANQELCVLAMLTELMASGG